MTELYKKNGAVFIPAGITFEEVEEVHEDMRIREDGGEWKEPLVEVEE